jgi:SAM-dependent methyltransferase
VIAEGIVFWLLQVFCGGEMVLILGTKIIVTNFGVEMLNHDNLEEFQDPMNYDCEFAALANEYGAFYVELAKQYQGNVLEIGCGTGLVALPIAELGRPTTGIDLSPVMLEYARLKAKDLPADFILADAKSFRTNKRFSLIYLTGNAFQAFLTRQDQEALLAAVKEHLEPNGVFAFETRNPSGTDLSLQENETPWHSYINAEDDVVQVSGTQRYDTITQLMHWVTIRRWKNKKSSTRIACRFIYPLELAALLHYNGFHIKEQYGDFDKSLLSEQSPSIISVCTLR